jgi:hypothetical protein
MPGMTHQPWQEREDRIVSRFVRARLDGAFRSDLEATRYCLAELDSLYRGSGRTGVRPKTFSTIYTYLRRRLSACLRAATHRQAVGTCRGTDSDSPRTARSHRSLLDHGRCPVVLQRPSAALGPVAPTQSAATQGCCRPELRSGMGSDARADGRVGLAYAACLRAATHRQAESSVVSGRAAHCEEVAAPLPSLPGIEDPLVNTGHR